MPNPRTALKTIFSTLTDWPVAAAYTLAEPADPASAPIAIDPSRLVIRAPIALPAPPRKSLALCQELSYTKLEAFSLDANIL